MYSTPRIRRNSAVAWTSMLAQQQLKVQTMFVEVHMNLAMKLRL